MKKYQDAEYHFRTALQVKIWACGENHESVAITKDHLAQLYILARRPDAAEYLYLVSINNRSVLTYIDIELH